jgi:hypothetical protein
MDGTRVNLAELVERQNVVIKEQADIIDDLFLLLLQHSLTEDLNDNEVEKIGHVARLKEEINV